MQTIYNIPYYLLGQDFPGQGSFLQSFFQLNEYDYWLITMFEGAEVEEDWGVK